MDRRVVVPLALVAVAGVLVLGAAGAFDPLLATDGYQPTDGPVTPTNGSGNGTSTAPGAHDGYERVTVAVVADGSNRTLGIVRAAVADTRGKRYTGLSETDHLPEDRGMWFVYDEPSNHTYVMRGMDYGLDILFVGADGRITSIHHAPEPPEDADGEDYRYPGYGQYVLEVNHEWTTRHNVSVGDRVLVDGERV